MLVLLELVLAVKGGAAGKASWIGRADAAFNEQWHFGGAVVMMDDEVYGVKWMKILGEGGGCFVGKGVTGCKKTAHLFFLVRPPGIYFSESK